MDGSSRITLADLSVSGNITGTGDIGGSADIAFGGTANADGLFTVDLVPASAAGRYRTDDLWTDPRGYLAVDVTGNASVALEFEIGPALLTWEGHYLVTTSAAHAIDAQLSAMFLTGDVSLPELYQIVNGVPESGILAVEACYVGESGGGGPCDALPGTWNIHAQGEVSAVYQLGGLTISEIAFNAAAGPHLFAGDFSAILEVPFGNYDDPLVFAIDADFGGDQMLGTVVTTFDERYIGETLLWIEGFTLTTFVEAHFSQPSLKLDFLPFRRSRRVLRRCTAEPGVMPNGVVTLGGFHGTLSRDGVLDIRIDEAVADFSAFHVEATDDPDAGEPAIHLVLGPDQPGDSVVLAITRAELTFPTLDKPLSLSADNMRFTRNGTFSMDAAELVASQGALETLGLAGVLPFDITRIHVAGIDNKPFTTQDFAAEITIDGEFDFRYLDDTPLKNPQVTIGTEGQNNQFYVHVHPGRRRSVHRGHRSHHGRDSRILEFGPLTINTSLTVGAYIDGAFFDNDVDKGVVFSGFFDALWIQGETSIGAGITLNEGRLDLSPESTHLAANATFDVTFVDPDSPFTFEKLGLTFDLKLDISKSFEVLNLGLFVQNAKAEAVEIHFGDLFKMRATGVIFDFTVFASDNVSDLPFATFGSLNVTFGDPDLGDGNPLSGLGGSAGNFGVGFVPATGDDPPRPRFFQLPDFFVDVDIPNVFPDWLPINLMNSVSSFLTPT